MSEREILHNCNTVIPREAFDLAIDNFLLRHDLDKAVSMEEAHAIVADDMKLRMGAMGLRLETFHGTHGENTWQLVRGAIEAIAQAGLIRIKE